MPPKKKLPKATRPDAERRLSQSDRLARLLRILEHVQGRGRWSAKELAEAEECTERTIYRAMQSLELAGVPWYFDKAERSYRVRADYKFPALSMTSQELIDQAAASVVAVAVSGSKTPLAINRKLKAAATAGEVLDDAEKLISVLGLQMAEHGKHRDVLRTVQRALLDRKQLAGKYKSPYDAKSKQLLLTPYRLCLVKQAWYLIATPKDSDAPRTYRVARFNSLRETVTTANVPQEFDLKEYFGDAWAAYRGDKNYKVEIEFTKDSADLVVETTWHATQEVRRQKNGTVRLSFRVDGLNEIVHWVLGWSGRARVIQPVELRELLVSHLQAALTLNQG